MKMFKKKSKPTLRTFSRKHSNKRLIGKWKLNIGSICLISSFKKVGLKPISSLLLTYFSFADSSSPRSNSKLMSNKIIYRLSWCSTPRSYPLFWSFSITSSIAPKQPLSSWKIRSVSSSLSLQQAKIPV
jgi:hypothetical protein